MLKKALAAAAVAVLASAGLVAVDASVSQAAAPALSPALNSNALYVSPSPQIATSDSSPRAAARGRVLPMNGSHAGGEPSG